jgi:hypothetical protein
MNSASEEAVKAAANSVPLPWGLIGVAKDFGVVVVLIWYLWFTQTSSIPNAQKEFHALLVKEREVFRSELAIQRHHDEKRTTDTIRAITDLTVELRRHRPE